MFACFASASEIEKGQGITLLAKEAKTQTYWVGSCWTKGCFFGRAYPWGVARMCVCELSTAWATPGASEGLHKDWLLKTYGFRLLFYPQNNFRVNVYIQELMCTTLPAMSEDVYYYSCVAPSCGRRRGAGKLSVDKTTSSLEIRTFGNRWRKSEKRKEI